MRIARIQTPAGPRHVVARGADWAVIDSPFGKMVFAVTADNKLEPRPVQLDGWSQGNWIVTQGLKSGDRILVEGFIKAHDPGMTVKPVPYVPATPGTAAGAPAPAASK